MEEGWIKSKHQRVRRNTGKPCDNEHTSGRVTYTNMYKIRPFNIPSWMRKESGLSLQPQAANITGRKPFPLEM